MKVVPLISVVTVVLNQKERLQRTLECIVKCGFPRIQYVVIDGGSTDGTLDVIRANQDVIDFWVSEPDRGISDAFNKGISVARGEVVGILNAGDWYEPDALGVIESALAANPDVDVFCGSIKLWEGSHEPLLCRSDPRSLEKMTSVYHPTVFIKRSSYSIFGGYDEAYRFAMDYELLLRYKQQGAKFLGLDDTLANMTLDGISRQHWYSGLREVRSARRKYFPLYNVVFFHVLAIGKNLVAIILKRVGGSSVYRRYWRQRNQQIKRGIKQGD
jgi:glycosyltransferase involved in cell wall biosynthesis